MTRVLLSLLAAFGVCLALTSVSGARQIDPRKIANDLKQMGLAYHAHNDATNKAPATSKDLGPYLENNKRLLDLLDNKDVVFMYGVRLIEMTDGSSNTILAYEKDVPTKGGFVLYGDASVKKITADDFKKAILAKPKKQ